MRCSSCCTYPARSPGWCCDSEYSQSKLLFTQRPHRGLALSQAVFRLRHTLHLTRIISGCLLTKMVIQHTRSFFLPLEWMPLRKQRTTASSWNFSETLRNEEGAIGPCLAAANEIADYASLGTRFALFPQRTVEMHILKTLLAMCRISTGMAPSVTRLLHSTGPLHTESGELAYKSTNCPYRKEVL